MFFLLWLNTIIIFILAGALILLYILLVYCVPTFVRNHVENTAKNIAPMHVLNLECIIEKVWCSWSGWSPFHTQTSPWWTSKCAGANKMFLSHNSLLFVVFFFSIFLQDRRHLFCKDGILFSRQKGLLNCCFLL